jgi:hypothetical protein
MNSIKHKARLAITFVTTSIASRIKDTRGEVNVVAIVVLIGIAILLAILFKDFIIGLLNMLFEFITGNATEAVS